MEATAVGLGAGVAGRWLKRRRAIVLTYHNVVPDRLAGLGDSSLHMPLSVFRRHLDLISGGCRPVALGPLLKSGVDDDAGGPSVALTFDDAYRGAVTLARVELEARGLPATIFVAPAILEDRTLWWDALARPGGMGLDPSVRSELLDRRRGTEEDALRLAHERTLEWTDMPELLRTCTLDELRDAAGQAGVTIGSHSWTHPSLTRLDPSGLQGELVASRAWVEEHFPDVREDIVSYPYGHVSTEVERATEAAGYQAGMALHKGWLSGPGDTDRFRVPRLNVPAGLSAEGLGLRLGWA